MKQTKKAFSFVEIIIVVSIIALLAVVWMSYQWAQNQNTKNTKAIWDLGTLNNSLLSYMEVEKTLPLPKWNKNYYTKETEYSHDEIWAYWVHGFVTQDLLPNKYLNYLPLDPRTNQYYAYWKTLDNKFYEVAWVLKENWEYVSKVKWNYPADNWPYSLIREYNWADFISDNSKVSFPYNPEERVLVAKINNYTWTIKITGKDNSYIISDYNWLLSHTLVQWDTIETWNSAKTTIFFSDWSQSVLEENSKLVLENLEFKEEDNLLTRVNLFLESGTLWTKATRLNQEDWGSDFEVYTDDTTAAVRWTIFGIKYDWTKTYVTVTEWEVKITPNWWSSIIKKTWESYNSTIHFSPFTIITLIPHNTLTWAILQNNNLVQEYLNEYPVQPVQYLTWGNIPNNSLYAKAEYNSINNYTLEKNPSWTISAHTQWLAHALDDSIWIIGMEKLSWTNHNFYSYNWEIWIFLDNYWSGNNQDYLYYNIDSDNDLWNNFKIEINARLSSIKSTWWPYYLLNWVEGSTDAFELYIEGWKINWTWTEIPNSKFDNNFHTFSIDNTWKVVLDWNVDLWTITINKFNKLYVWVNYDNLFWISYIQQYNDIINYLKIYKN